VETRLNLSDEPSLDEGRHTAAHNMTLSAVEENGQVKCEFNVSMVLKWSHTRREVAVLPEFPKDGSCISRWRASEAELLVERTSETDAPRVEKNVIDLYN
jgi:hypothetical protein